MAETFDPRGLIVELCRQFYAQGWFSGTGGGFSIRHEGRIYIAPSGVQKERLSSEDLFVLDEDGLVLSRPTGNVEPSACTPLFLNAYRMRNAGAVLHSHSENAMLVTLIYQRVFEVTHLEMMKGVTGVGYHDRLRVPIIENTARECDLASGMAQAMREFPETHAVLVRRHGVYVWGSDWIQTKNHAECYDYLFGAALRMKSMGLNPSQAPREER
jgi:methylthioribulose-1-phosphate dehydratase